MTSPYYALPLVIGHDDLESTLDRMVFVNARAIPDETSVINIPEDYCRGGKRESTDSLDVYCSEPTDTGSNWMEQISASQIYGWEELYADLTACNIGFQIRYHGESRGDIYHDEHTNRG